MKITILQKTQYKNNPILILHFGKVFMYLLEYAGEFYQDHVVLKPSVSRYLICFLGFVLRPVRILIDRRFTYAEYQGSKFFRYRMVFLEILMSWDTWYSREQIDSIKQAMVSGAVATIDSLNNKKAHAGSV